MLAQRVVAVGRGQEVARDQLGALVDKLVKGMLAVGAGLPPDHRPGGVIHPLPCVCTLLPLLSISPCWK